ncbi:membrane protein FAM174A isoform X2 [Globicephala melas]|uniref:Transmembrane protein 157 n=1 Tax=Tursiops truncatus TaxID=9739 RepID=A0A2U4BT31_TURTR|nr:membrane protein FAM174A isoform X1 [Tursiops truncatus]XP_019796311.1 membrane protein FAM174A isoform X2 [Tursiops truncatus]XP_026956340.1 membrane protein FAM174A isoform X1 [Lagenorhynchus obliquidens]XP_026956341.1 membrane protein FAM174A isoform X2 [Lagenorhynchus obliquidens]XP_030704331.1 membrane protein FAM174A isoform X1 [Globicephala melas]XP_030704340.1 membrane protein FAM174A isoform X2 [Globicephala melas]
MKATHCSCCLSHLLASALLLLLLLPELRGPLEVLLQAAEAVPDPMPPDRGPRTLPPLPSGPTAAQSPGRAPAEAEGPRGAEGVNSSTPSAGLAAEDPGGKAGEEGPVGGVLAVSPNPGDKPMTQRALTVLMVVSGAVLVYFVVRTVRMRRRNRKTRRYGVLDTNIENMELTPLEQDDEDDDNTLFDVNHPRR